MIYEYAIDPEIAADSKNLQILENYFGFDKARVIVRYPYNWELVVLTKACDISGDINRAKVEEQLRRLNGKKAYKSIKNTYNVAREWLSNSLDVTPPFHCIVSNEEEDDVVNISDVNPSHFKFNTPTSTTLNIISVSIGLLSFVSTYKSTVISSRGSRLSADFVIFTLSSFSRGETESPA